MNSEVCVHICPYTIHPASCVEARVWWVEVESWQQQCSDGHLS